MGFTFVGLPETFWNPQVRKDVIRLPLLTKRNLAE